MSGNVITIGERDGKSFLVGEWVLDLHVAKKQIAHNPRIFVQSGNHLAIVLENANAIYDRVGEEGDVVIFRLFRGSRDRSA